MLAGAACGRRHPDGPPVPSRPPVGITTRVFEDDSRGRRLTTEIWYPAAAGAKEANAVADGIFPGRAARDAPVAARGGLFPLLLLSHGSGGDRFGLAWLGEAFAAHGWVAAAVEHPGDRRGDATSEGAFAVWRRPGALSRVLTRLLADPSLGPRLDPGRVAAAGHSSGGATVLQLAGARLRPAAMLAYCAGPRRGADCDRIDGVEPSDLPDLDGAGRARRDRRIRAVLALAPVFGPGLTGASLRAIRTPVLIVASPTDELVPFAPNARRLARAIPDARLLTVPGAGHFAFLPVCNALGRVVARTLCVDPSSDPDRETVHRRVVADALRFFDEALHTGGARETSRAARADLPYYSIEIDGHP